ncbi:MAG: BadF/BadG/BcrA/BcrD ATPase family protein [Pirellulales bacterium]
MTDSAKHPQWVIGVDGGGTKTAVAAYRCNSCDVRPPLTANDLQFGLAVTRTGSAHPNSWSTAQESLTEVIHQTVASIGDANSIAAVHLALAGAGREEDRKRVLAFLESMTAWSSVTRLSVSGDIDPLLDFQVNSAELSHVAKPLHSIAAILGTGSIVASRDGVGGLLRAGGWGPNLGDEGSGWAITRAALRLICNWIDEGMPPSDQPALVTRVVDALLGNEKVERDRLAAAVIAAGVDRKAVAMLTAAVLRSWIEEGDATAGAIVQCELQLFCRQIQMLVARLGCAGRWRLQVSGGLVTHFPQVERVLVEELSRLAIAPCEIINVDPIVAAVQAAWRNRAVR